MQEPGLVGLLPEYLPRPTVYRGMVCTVASIRHFNLLFEQQAKENMPTVHIHTLRQTLTHKTKRRNLLKGDKNLRRLLSKPHWFSMSDKLERTEQNALWLTMFPHFLLLIRQQARSQELGMISENFFKNLIHVFLLCISEFSSVTGCELKRLVPAHINAGAKL